MTAFPGAGTALDRAGGRPRFAGLVAEHYRPNRDLHLEVGDSPRHYHLLLVDADGQVVAEIRSVPISSSRAVSSDQLYLMERDLRELRPILAEILGELDEASIPELEKRALGGDR